MPVKFITKTPVEYVDPWTGEVFEGSVDIDRISHENESHNRIIVLRPIVDTLTATVSINKAWDYIKVGMANSPKIQLSKQAYLDQLFKTVYQVHDRGHWSNKFDRAKRYGNGYRYNLALKAPKLKSRPVFSFKAAPKLNASTFRMEFSASQLREDVPKIMQQRWASLDDKVIPFPALMETAKISRIDIAIDVLNLPVSEIIPYHEKARTVWTAQTQLSPIETMLVYIPPGNKKTPHQSYKKRANLQIYDKKAEHEANDEEPTYGGLPHTRIEFGHVRGPKLKNVAKWKPKNPPEWRFFWYHHLDDTEKRSDASLMDSIRVRGLRGLSNMMSAAPQDIEALAKQYPDDLIDPDTFSEMKSVFGAGALGQLIDWATTPIEQLIPQQ